MKEIIKNIKEYIHHKKILARYFVAVKRIKKQLKESSNIRVLFLATEDCKWNYHSLYNALNADPLFETILLFAPRNSTHHLTTENIQKNFSFLGV